MVGKMSTVLATSAGEAADSGKVAGGNDVVVGDGATIHRSGYGREPSRLGSRSLSWVPSAIAARPLPQCRGKGKRTYWPMTSTIAASSLSALMCCALIRRSACAVATSGGVPGGLALAEVAAVAEHGEHVAPDGLGELRIGAGGGPK